MHSRNSNGNLNRIFSISGSVTNEGAITAAAGVTQVVFVANRDGGTYRTFDINANVDLPGTDLVIGKTNNFVTADDNSSTRGVAGGSGLVRIDGSSNVFQNIRVASGAVLFHETGAEGIDDKTYISGNLIIDAVNPGNTNSNYHRVSNGDFQVGGNLVINESGALPATANVAMFKVEAQNVPTNNWGLGDNIHDRLLDGTLVQGPDGIVVKDNARFEIGMLRTNNLVLTVAQKITIDNTGPTYSGNRTIDLRGESNVVNSGNVIIHATNVWMRDGSYLRVNESSSIAALGLVLDGAGPNAVAYLSESTSADADDFDLLDVISSSNGVARTLQIGTANNATDTGLEVALLGTSSQDVTLDVRHGTLTVTNGAGNFQGVARAGGYAAGTNGLIRLVGTTLDQLSNITGRIEVGDFGQLDIRQPRTNAISFIGNEIRVANTGSGAYYFGTQSVIAVNNLAGGSGTTLYALTNVVMAADSSLRVDTTANTLAAVGLKLEGNATLSDGVGTTSDDFGLIDVVSSSPGSARTLQLGVSGGGEESFQTILAGVASSDITFDIVNGSMVVTNAGGDVQGSVKVRAGSTFASQNATEELLNLYGNGVVIGNVLVSNVLAPGLSPGTLTVTGNMQFVATSILDFELSATSTNAGANINDLLQIAAGGGFNGDLALDGTLQWTNVASVAGQGWGAGDFWTLITYEGSLTDFGLDLGTLPTLDDGFMWMLDTTTQLGEVRLSIVIPEPSTWALLAIGSIAVAVLSRRRRRG